MSGGEVQASFAQGLPVNMIGSLCGRCKHPAGVLAMLSASEVQHRVGSGWPSQAGMSGSPAEGSSSNRRLKDVVRLEIGPGANRLGTGKSFPTPCGR